MEQNNNKNILSKEDLEKIINIQITPDFLIEFNQNDNYFNKNKNKKINFINKNTKEEEIDYDDYKPTFQPNLQILPHMEILTFKKLNENDNFDINIQKYGKGLYIMKKWCIQDVKSIINEFLQKNRYKILWEKVKNYCFSEVLKNKIKKIKQNNFIQNLKNILYKKNNFKLLKNIKEKMSIIFAKEKNLGVYEVELKKLENNILLKEEYLKTQYSFLKNEENKLKNILIIEEHKISDYINIEKTKKEKWFGFNNNEDLMNIFLLFKY